MVAPPDRALDTSVAVPLLMENHAFHQTVVAWAGGRPLRLCGHALVETYSVLTRLPGDARVDPQEATQLLDGFEAPVLLSEAGARTAPHRLAHSGVFGGAAWDGLVALAALEHGVTLVTRDVRALATYDALGVATEVLRDPV